ncbi:hypothetical protein MPTK1_5g15360 [Marchantia polymorpha subsp. ruderalis]|uniref:Trichome birefringence-like C-terminal domain-containing protein n=2 Tax=Marchantia polymorpha TaxID=3197 RepID=A0AAF6BIM7_MARPO|nr:hypothetical protein MARPO_0071s0073 [Marchantia polymorpha]BBN11861.1 hypothetical protein Mp_5g15360 [Marchantia polymorpha subsp. ruderalis]|eukprot:PTQ35460.1 hypothetical protein MARPO_0071s0073 [Marchantia polymorpha]
MMMTSSNSPNAPYLRHAREHQKANEGWTVTLKIAIPKPRHWLACSTGWIVLFIVYLSSTLWVSGFNRHPYLSSNSSAFSKYLQGPVTRFPAMRAVHDPEEVYEEMLEPGTDSEDPFLSNAAMSTWSPVVPSTSSDSIPLSVSRENIEAVGLTLPGTDPSNTKDAEVEPGRYPAPTMGSEDLVERDRLSPSLVPSTVTRKAPAPYIGSRQAGDHEPADSADVVDLEYADPPLANGSPGEELDEKIFPPGSAQGESLWIQGRIDDAQSVDTSHSPEVSRVEAPMSSPAEEEHRVEHKEASEDGPAPSPQPGTPENSSTSSWTEVAPKAAMEDGDSLSSPTESSSWQQQHKEASEDGPAPGPQPNAPENSSTSSWTEVAPEAAMEDGDSLSSPTESSSWQQQEETGRIKEHKEASEDGPAPSPQPSAPENSNTSSWTEVAPKAAMEDGISHLSPTESSSWQQQEETPNAATVNVTDSAMAPGSWKNFFPAEETKVETPSSAAPTSEGEPEPEPEPVIRATSIRGRKAVAAFRTYFDCVSESGKWVYDPTPRPLPWSFVGERYLTMCDGYHEMLGGVYGEQADRIALSGDGKWEVREALKWVWQSNDTCPLQRVARDELCRRLGPRRNVMVVGDSLNHGLSWSIMNHLITNGTGYARFMNYDRTTDGVYEMCADIFGQGNGFKISFVRNDRLSLVSAPVYDDRSNFHEYPWMDLVGTYGVKILLLNRGAHYENDTVYERSLRETFTALRKTYPDVQVIYRNTPPGHANCTNTTAVPPLAQRQEFGWDGVKWPDFYSWGLFARQNVLARKIVEEFEYIYMDVDTMLALRADGHPHPQDCLHYCLPGPSDIGVQLLYNMLPFL